jgi:lipoprotein Spr
LKHLVIILSALLTLTFSANARCPINKVGNDTSVKPARQEPQFLDNIVIGDDEGVQDDKKKKSTSKSSSAGSEKKKTKLAALTPAEKDELPDIPRKHEKAIGIELTPPLNFKYAILLDQPVEMINDTKLLELIDSWYGTKYKYGGDSRKGVDCSAFTQAFMLSYYDKNIPRNSEEQYQQSKHIKKKKLRQGDLVFFRTKGRRGGISHVGVYLCNNKFVHASTSSGVMISDLGEDYYSARYAGAGRIE